MNKLTILTPDKKNLQAYLYTGILLFFISIIDVSLSSFFNINLTSFLPGFISFILPLVLGFIGLHLIRIEYSGIKQLDLLNKNINTNSFNAFLSLIIIFVIINLYHRYLVGLLLMQILLVIVKMRALVQELVGLT